MKLQQYPLTTYKESPNSAELVSHQLMLRGGFIRRVAAGLYTWSPIGLKVLSKVEGVVRVQMNRHSAHELKFPTLQPAALWQTSGRWNEYGDLLLKIQDRGDAEFCYGPTNEESICSYFKQELVSYKQLPQVFYQIQTKFRDETRPRFGVMRAREFLMKDAYSFHLDSADLHTTYQSLKSCYSTIFSELGLDFKVVEADSGDIGGQYSHEFHVIAQSGEDTIAYCEESEYAANVEHAPAPSRRVHESTALSARAPAFVKDSQSLTRNLDGEHDTIAVFFSKDFEDRPVCILINAEDQLNSVKLSKQAKLKNEPVQVRPADLEELGKAISGSYRVFADQGIRNLRDVNLRVEASAGYWQGVDLIALSEHYEHHDLRNVKEGESSPDHAGKLKIAKGIEVGHIFQLGDKYSTPFDLVIPDQNGISRTLQMGCYGIGVSRVVAACIEQNHDEKGIIWPRSIAPFLLAIVPIEVDAPAVMSFAEHLYEKSKQAHIDVCLDDRTIRFGARIKDMELIGVPFIAIASKRGIEGEQYELMERRSGERRLLSWADVVKTVTRASW